MSTKNPLFNSADARQISNAPASIGSIPPNASYRIGWQSRAANLLHAKPCRAVSRARCRWS